jgi:hypothetical protein
MVFSLMNCYCYRTMGERPQVAKTVVDTNSYQRIVLSLHISKKVEEYEWLKSHMTWVRDIISHLESPSSHQTRELFEGLRRVQKFRTLYQHSPKNF